MELNTVTGSVTSPEGFLASAVAANLKYQARLDTALIVSETVCNTAAVFTKNQVVAAPVVVDREIIQTHPESVRVIVANAGLANACTGQQGLANARTTQMEAAKAVGCTPNQVLLLSTGVIGQQLPMEKLTPAIHTASQSLSADGGIPAAVAIMTTDTSAKHASLSFDMDGHPVTLGGIAKGAGMIHPNMATMLAVMTTDAAIPAPLLQACLVTAVNQSFNRISVDGDTSTNDTVLLLANGRSGVNLTTLDEAKKFVAALTQLATYLAQKIVKDGEGATKFVEINVDQGPTDEAAHQIANTIATSPLVKTAFAGSDPNWGRILAAAGRAGVLIDQHQLDLSICHDVEPPLQLLKNGTPMNYLESQAAAIFAKASFKIRLSLNQGQGAATVWTSDLSHNYVTINADYRT